MNKILSASTTVGRACLTLCFAVLLIALVESSPQSVQSSPKAPVRGLRCPLSVQQLVQYAPDDSVGAVKQACDPTASKDFCEACICTVFANFVPATLQSAGILTNSTPPGAADEAIGSCAPSSHVALLQLGALTEAWSAALNSRCNEMTPHSPEGACKQYTPKALPVKKAATAATAAARTTTRCPFDAEDIKPKELQAAQEACGAGAGAGAGSSNTTSSSFCSSCICSIQTTLDTIIKNREALLSGSTAAKNGDDEYRGCYVILTQALVEGDVLTPEAAGVLGSEQCRSFTQQTPAERRAACKKESAPKAPTPANNGTESESPADSSPKPPTERSAGSMTGFGGLGGSAVTCLVALVAAWVIGLAH